MGAIESVFKLINEWQPEALPTELKYRDSLATYLRSKLKDDVKVETEYRHNGTTTDVYVKQPGFFGDTEVFVELKRNLTQKSQLDRLVGQIHALEPKKNKILVVLCGETVPALAARFKDLFKERLYSAFGVPVYMGLIIKEATKSAAK